jgi:hypothetical protein
VDVLDRERKRERERERREREKIDRIKQYWIFESQSSISSIVSKIPQISTFFTFM